MMLRRIITAAVLAAVLAAPAAAHISADCKAEYRKSYAASAVVAHRLERLSDAVFLGSTKLDLEKALASLVMGMVDDEDAFNSLMDCIRGKTGAR